MFRNATYYPPSLLDSEAKSRTRMVALIKIKAARLERIARVSNRIRLTGSPATTRHRLRRSIKNPERLRPLRHQKTGELRQSRHTTIPRRPWLVGAAR